ncbi:MAG: HAD family hydrolase [Chloroflexia bacterium]
MPQLVLFLDDGGVISDHSRRAPQWQRLIGEFLPPLLGGRAEDWIEPNKAFTAATFEPAAWESRLASARDYWDLERTYLLDWLNGMCDKVGVERLPEEEGLALSRRANIWITSRVRADFPGVVETIVTLYNRGYRLNMASGESSTDLEGYLRTLGVRDRFNRLYGPDLINTLKAGPEFYERMFADACVAPGDALVVDDSPSAIGWASQVGARTILVTSQQTDPLPDLIAIRSLAELPTVIDSLA